MKIVYLYDGSMPSDQAHGLQVVRTCESLAALGHSVTLLHSGPPTEANGRHAISVSEHFGCEHEFVSKALPRPDLPVIVRKLPLGAGQMLNGIWWLRWQNKMSAAAAGLNADVYFSRESSASSLLALARSGRNVIVEFHRLPKRRMVIRSARELLTTHGRRAYGFAVTSMLARDVEALLGLPSGALGVHHDGVDLSRFAELGEMEPIKRRPNVVYAGSLLANRGVDVLIEAAARCPDADFRIIGGTREEVASEKARAEVFGARNVAFEGYIHPNLVPRALRAADLLVLPMRGDDVHTRRHASPLKLFEYMASGVATVATDLPSVREVVTHMDTAYLVESGNPDDLAKGIQFLLGNPLLARSIAQNALRAVQQYSWEERGIRVLTAAGFQRVR